ncbi:Aste57867_9249 [Aphanomyces stellatus]|uniref:Aste57867_9249 protein n=1 Tax=Aphanomyces stellatus TaxID=120398 RepID=A0A485KMB8_9STRA|nr:hypothetical protein As57867_009213 [Aphanomyces stellatus]VFT86132.1 Aste57867_9249 [Aphanomyces stellatus]
MLPLSSVQPSMMQPSSTALAPRFIASINLSSSSIHCTRVTTIQPTHFALSHRWQDRSSATCNSFTVFCDHDPPYTVSLTLVEATNILSYLTQTLVGDGLWLDYVCVNQADKADACAQVHVMGHIYTHATSVIVGDDLGPVMPPRAYLRRAWCVQERMFGPIRFVWDMDAQDGAYLAEFAADVASRVDGLAAIAACLHRPYDAARDRWRLAALLQHGPVEAHGWRHHLAKLTLGERTAENRRAMAVAILRLRELVTCTHAVDPSEWHCLVFDCEATVEKDRLFGPWGHPLRQIGLDVQYDRPDVTWRRLAIHFPEAEYAFHASRATPATPHGGFSGFATVHQLVQHVTDHERLPPGRTAATPLLGSMTVALPMVSLSVLLAWDVTCVALAWDSQSPDSHRPHTTFHFVVSKACLARGRRRGHHRQGDGGHMKKFYAVVERLQLLGADIPRDHGAAAAHFLKLEMERLVEDRRRQRPRRQSSHHASDTPDNEVWCPVPRDECVVIA